MKVWSALSTPTPDFEYYPTRFSKKFVFPSRLIISIHSNGKQVSIFVVSLVAEGGQDQELVSAELDVVAHHGQIYLNYKTWHHMVPYLTSPAFLQSSFVFAPHIIM